MGESHQLTNLGGVKGRVGSMGDGRRRNRQVKGDVHLPEAVGGVAAVAHQDGLIIVGDSHGIFGEGVCPINENELIIFKKMTFLFQLNSNSSIRFDDF